MLVRLTIDKQRVLDAVGAQTEYTAVKADTAAINAPESHEGGAVDILPTQAHDIVLLDKYWAEAASELTTRIGRHLEDVNEDAHLPALPGLMPWSGYDARIRVPSSWPMPLLRSLTKAAEAYLTHAILGRWYKTCGMADQATVAFTEAEGHGNNVTNLICKRR